MLEAEVAAMTGPGIQLGFAEACGIRVVEL